jgi:hypothetical protein
VAIVPGPLDDAEYREKLAELNQVLLARLPNGPRSEDPCNST